MLFLPAVAVTGFAAFTSAFLLPPTTSSDDKDIISTLPFEVVAESDARIINVPCTRCPVLVAKTPTGLVYTKDIESELSLDFQINHLKSSDSLTLNGVQIFPIDQDLNAMPLQATQVTKDGSDVGYLHSVGLGYEARIELINNPTEEEQLAIYNVLIQVVEVAGQWVDDLEAVQMKLIATPAGGLMIAETITIPTTNPTIPPGMECTTMVCKLKQAFGSSIPRLGRPFGKKPCGGKSEGGLAAALASGNHHGKAHGKGHGHAGPRPHGHGQGQHRHGRHHRLHKLLHSMRSVALHVLIPVFVGIVAGMTASFIGMIVGHFIVFLWRALYRREQPGGYSKVCHDESFIEDVKEPGEDIEAPPSYKDEEVVVLSEKEAEL